jgi:hypothetical protein
VGLLLSALAIIGMESMQPIALDDDNTIEAIGILADVLDGVSERGGLDTVLVSKALRQVVATRSQPAFEFATRAFNTLDPTLRQRVAENADNAAHGAVELRHRIGGFLAIPARKPATASPQPALLQALNLRTRRRSGME